MSEGSVKDHFVVKKGQQSFSKAQEKQKSTIPDISEKDMEILQQFDLHWEYGPCTGITRMERWNRANKFGLQPEPVVKDLIVAHLDDERYTKCLWKDYEI